MRELGKSSAVATGHWAWQAPEAWNGRVDDPSDPEARRWHDAVHAWDGSWPCGGTCPGSGTSTPDPLGGARRPRVWLIGCASDLGVGRNLGRTGAAAAPAQIRKAMCNLPLHFGDAIELVDAGDVLPLGEDLEGALEGLSSLVAAVVASGAFPVVLGGGHEIALGSWEGIRRGLAARGDRHPPRIVSFDAHFDLRPEGPAHAPVSSGSMFRRIARICAERGEPFLYHVIGIQRSGNTASLFKLADELGVDYRLARDLDPRNLAGLLGSMAPWIADGRPIHATLCCDVIAAAHAPAVSAPQPFGLDPEIVLEAMRFLARSGVVAGLDVAEVSPRFDHDNRTAHLVAILIFAWINALAGLE